VLGQDTVVVFCENGLLSQQSISLPAEGKLRYEWFTHTISVEAAVALLHASKTWRQRPAGYKRRFKNTSSFLTHTH
jgi:hypothetical protein